ncbi:YrhA family protein [Inquilinus sp. Marseille-Q2685]|uniref:YrhA family protein n=1 Tax=Inquilinus sp. Marseille-Q2685 TaxID=2866581 RepID=UPI001CE4AE52|nr:YrhA family protein [Inquilinus sp. Marseille-Q2685]
MEDLAKLLNQIKAERVKWGDHTPSGASEECLSRISGQISQEFGYMLDPGHLNFFRLCDGLDNNGYLIYSSGCNSEANVEDLISANRAWHEDSEKKIYTFIAESGDSLFCHNNNRGIYCMLDRYSLDEYEEYDSAEELLRSVLKKMIDERT